MLKWRDFYFCRISTYFYLTLHSSKIPLRRGKVLITTSWDDGLQLDVKLCSVLKGYGMRATMYIPIANLENKVILSDTIRDIANDFEIGGHTYNHIGLTKVDENR
jgi:peptidoglycan/xylan/chitin deacetylase (PgdA/CDA1 family)